MDWNFVCYTQWDEKKIPFILADKELTLSLSLSLFALSQINIQCVNEFIHFRLLGSRYTNATEMCVFIHGQFCQHISSDWSKTEPSFILPSNFIYVFDVFVCAYLTGVYFYCQFTINSNPIDDKKNRKNYRSFFLYFVNNFLLLLSYDDALKSN